MAKDDAAEPIPIPDVKPGTYSDGHPLDEMHYLECKIILMPERFTWPQSYADFGKLVSRLAKDSDLGHSTEQLTGQKPQIREVVFLDTADFRLYKNAFILRRRVAFEDGFPAGDPEVVLKFRHPDLQKAAELDMRPSTAGVFPVKLKAEALPLRDRLGGMRLLYSHTVEFWRSQTTEQDRASLANLARLFPCLAPLKQSETEKLEIVNQTIIEEIMVDLGALDFGKGLIARTNAALWRGRGDHKPLVGEFSYQVKFDRKEDLHAKAMRRCEQFFCALQNVASDWISLGTTKTGAVYRLNGNAPQGHE